MPKFSKPLSLPNEWRQDLIQSVAFALSEDIKNGDITAELIPATNFMTANVITQFVASIGLMKCLIRLIKP
jgi:nicotinate-nucleotide pyrophosphorylase